MNILFLTGCSIFPPNAGGRLACFNRVKALSTKHSVHVFSTIKQSEYDEMMSYQWNSVCDSLDYIIRKNTTGVLIKSIFSPYNVVSRVSNRYKETLNDLIERYNIDIIIYEGPGLASYCDDIKVKQVIDSHNLEFDLFYRQGKNQKNILKKILYFHEYLTMKNYEKRVYQSNHINGMTFISMVDMNNYINTFNLKNEMVYIPQGMERKKICNEEEKANIISFISSMDYYPNIEGALWLIRDVLPHVIKEKPDTKLYIVGKNPDSSIIESSKNNSNVIITGTVDDIAPYYYQSSLILIPIFSGSGVKIKLIEAASFNKIIISTKFGIVGSSFTKNEVITEDNAILFANRIIDILNNKSMYETFRNKAYSRYINDYCIDSVSERYLNFIDHIRKQ